MAGLIDVAEVVLLGCVPNTNFDAVPAVILNVPDVAPVSEEALAESVYPVPDLLIDNVLNVAMPPDADTVTVPDNVPPPGFVPIAIVMLFVAVVTRFPYAS